MRFNPAVIEFHVLSQQSNGFVLLKQQETVSKGSPQLLGPDVVAVTARDLTSKIEDAIFKYYSKLENLRNLISNNSLFEMRDN